MNRFVMISFSWLTFMSFCEVYAIEKDKWPSKSFLEGLQETKSISESRKFLKSHYQGRVLDEETQNSAIRLLFDRANAFDFVKVAQVVRDFHDSRILVSAVQDYYSEGENPEGRHAAALVYLSIPQNYSRLQKWFHVVLMKGGNALTYGALSFLGLSHYWSKWSLERATLDTEAISFTQHLLFWAVSSGLIAGAFVTGKMQGDYLGQKVIQYCQAKLIQLKKAQ